MLRRVSMPRSSGADGSCGSDIAGPPGRIQRGTVSAVGEDRAVPRLAGHPGGVLHDVLDARVVLQRVARQVLAEAGSAVAAVRHLADDRDVVVDPDTARAELSSRAQRAVHVAGPDRG